jgi:hypothetical protein
MPLPTPSGNESREDFVSRCASDIADEFPDNKQRIAVCNSQWRKLSKSDAPYGYCPECESPGVERERRPNGNDKCGDGHTYPSANALHKSLDTDDQPQSDIECNYEFVKADEHPDYTFILGPVLVPEKVDKQGDIVSSEEIEKAAHGYVEDSQRPGLMHALILGSRDAKVVESYVTRDATKINGVTIAKGTWMLGMRVYAKKLRKLIREGKLSGYSIGGKGVATPE